MKKILLFLLWCVSTLFAVGQEKKWHELEGYFQNPRNKEMTVRFTATDSLLLAKALWNNADIHLVPDTGLAFISKEQDDGNPIRIRFLRDASGKVNQVMVAGNDVWTRVIDYKAVVKQEMAHTPDQLQRFVGLYQGKDDTTNFIRLGVDSNTLTIHQMWDGNVVDNFAPESAMNFFKKERPVITLIFSADQKGEITQFIAFGRDVWIKRNNPEIIPVRFKSYEGIYRSKTDPDNELQLIASGSSIIVRQLWDKKEIRVEPLTNSYFYNEQKAFPLHIITDGQGQVKSILIVGLDRFDRVTK
jgi:hypothetical protein